MNDLKQKIPDTVLKNQKPKKGEPYIVEIDNLLHEYHHDKDLFVVERLVNKIKSEIGWFERISTHAPSVGGFYEHLVYSAIKEVLPSDLKIGTGFVYDSDRRQASVQIDIIIYQDKTYPPLYQRNEFVVVDSKYVIACGEVKKTLNANLIDQIISKYSNINLGNSPNGMRGVQFINVFSFYSKLSIQKIAEKITKSLVSYFNTFKSETKSGQDVNFILNHLVLPNFYFFDKTGYLQCSCKPFDETSILVELAVYRSSLGGHSLGEFLVSMTAYEQQSVTISNKDFLSFPLRITDSNQVVYRGLELWQYFSMQDLIEKFPDDILKLKKLTKKERRPYGALVSASANLKHVGLEALERSKGFKWLAIDSSENDPKTNE